MKSGTSTDALPITIPWVVKDPTDDSMVVRTLVFKADGEFFLEQ